jgi:hypothetical protein
VVHLDEEAEHDASTDGIRDLSGESNEEVWNHLVRGCRTHLELHTRPEILRIVLIDGQRPANRVGHGVCLVDRAGPRWALSIIAFRFASLEPRDVETGVQQKEGDAMASTPDVRPVGDLPDAIGKTAARELSANGITSLQAVATRSRTELLAIHGVGPKAIAILGEALAATGLAFEGD